MFILFQVHGGLAPALLFLYTTHVTSPNTKGLGGRRESFTIYHLPGQQVYGHQSLPMHVSGILVLDILFHSVLTITPCHLWLVESILL